MRPQAGQKKRTQKVSKGVNGGGGKVALTPMEKVLLGGGSYRAFKPLGGEAKKKAAPKQ